MSTTDTGQMPFYGMYRGICVNNQDPEGFSRITALVPQVFGNDTVASDWAWPSFPSGWGELLTWAQSQGFTGDMGLPATSAPVWISFMGGDVNNPIWHGVWMIDS